jgi:hypothetical protein
MIILSYRSRLRTWQVFACTCVIAACGNGIDIDETPAFAVQLLEFPGADGSGQAHLSPAPSGGPVLSWLEPAGDDYALRYVQFDGAQWSRAVTVTSSDRLFINWADFPSVVPIDDDHWVAHWLARQPDSFGAYDPMTSVSNDSGLTWSGAVKLNDDVTEAEHGFVRLFPWGDSTGAFWLDGRELANWSFDEPEALLGVSLRVARVAADGSITERAIVDPMVCDCCQPDVAMGPSGPLVTYRDRTADDIRDIVVRTFSDGQWQEPISVGSEAWFIEGCPVNGPAIASVNRSVAVAWFTAADNRPRVRYARSDDAGEKFGSAIDIDTDGAYGQVDVIVDSKGSSVVSWWRRGAEGGIDLVIRSVSAGGELGPIQTVAHEAQSQPIDVPQMLALADGLLFAWTSFEGAGSIKTALVSLP